MSKVAPDPAYPPPPPPAYAYAATGGAGGFAPPPPPGYPGAVVGGPGTGSTHVYVTQPMAYGPRNGSTAMYTEAPMLIVCQHCRATVTTTTHYTIGMMTWLAAGLIIILGFWLLCCLIPFCINACKDVSHTCPNCRALVGRYQRL